MEEPINLSDTEDFSLQDTSLMQNSKDHQDYLIMTIELGDGQQQHIKIHATDDPQQLAHDFIQLHHLNFDLEQSLSSLIQQNLGLLDKRSQPSPFLKSSISNYHSLTKDNKVFNSQGALKYTPKINRNSLMITSKQSRQGEIHERLYRLAKKKKPKSEQVTVSTSEKSTSYFNPGEILYIKGISMKHAKMRKIEEKTKEKEEKEMKGITFKPCINTSEARYDEKTEDILLKKAKDYEEHKKVLKEKFDKEEVKECSFRPNASSKPREVNPKVHEHLYKEAHKRQEKQMELSTMKLFPFEPNQNKPKSTQRTESREEFVDRLINSKIKLQEEMEKLRAIQDFDHDQITGQKLFKPITLVSHEADGRRGGKAIWEYLYEMKDAKKEKIKKVLDEEESFWHESGQLKLGQQSQKVFEKFRIKQYKSLFEELDSDNDGQVSAEKINLENIPEKTLEVLSPLLEHLLNSGEMIEFQQFSEHLEELRSHLDLHSRSFLLKRPDKFERVEIDPHPKLNSVTLEIAERLRTDESIYDRQVKGKIMCQLKLEKKKELEQEAIVKDCSFRPTLVANGRFK